MKTHIPAAVAPTFAFAPLARLCFGTLLAASVLSTATASHALASDIMSHGKSQQALVNPGQTQRLDGTLSIEMTDFSHDAELKYWLKDKQGKRTELKLSSKPGWLKHGQTVRVFGWSKADKFEVDGESVSLLQTNETTSATTSASLATTNASGAHSVLVAEVNFSVNPIVRFTTAAIEELVLNQTSQFYQENSYDAMSLSGDVTSPITVNISTSVCDTDTIAQQADAIFRQRGFEPNNYQHVMYLIPTHPKCTWSGKANVGGPRSWIKRVELSTVSHEMGHNLGLYHANKKDCGSVTTDGASCTVSEYGDYLSAMSATSTPKHFNGFHKEQLGWLSGRVATRTSSGTVTLSTLESVDTFAPKVAKIKRGVDAAGNNQWYYIEYRQAQGFDSSLETEAPTYLTGIRLREGTDNNPASSNLLDPTPNSSSYDWDDISLAPGQSYSLNGVTLSVLSSNNSQVVLDVQIGGGSSSSCTTKAASFVALSGTSVSAQGGDNVSFGYRLTNNDSLECAPVNFNLSRTLANGLSGQFNLSQVSLSPGQSQTVNLSINVATSAASGQYAVNSTAVRQDNNQGVNQAATIVVSSTSSNTAPQASDDAVNLSVKQSVTIAVLANDFDADGDALVITGVSQGAKGSVVLNSNNTLTYTPGKGFKNGDSFSYSISDGSLSSTANVSISLTSSGGSGGGKGRK